MQTATSYLETLNPEQRSAVEHGAVGGLAAAPLLVIAGAGSGKTNTLAHRVAHLIVQGADPRVIVTLPRRTTTPMICSVFRKVYIGHSYAKCQLNDTLTASKRTPWRIAARLRPTEMSVSDPLRRARIQRRPATKPPDGDFAARARHLAGSFFDQGISIPVGNMRTGMTYRLGHLSSCKIKSAFSERVSDF